MADNNAITPNELSAMLKNIKVKKGGDPEACHANADDLLCLVLKQLGYGEAVEIFDSLPKWYA